MLFGDYRIRKKGKKKKGFFFSFKDNIWLLDWKRPLSLACVCVCVVGCLSSFNEKYFV